MYTNTTQPNNLQLDENSRSKLDGVVMKMQQNKESDENIQAVVNDFKQKYGKPVDTTPVPDGGTPPPEKGLLGKLGDRAKDFGSDVSTMVKNIPTDVKAVIDPLGGHKESIGTDMLNVAGDAGGAITDTAGAGIGLLNKGLRYIPGVSQTEDAVMGGISSGVSAAANTGVGKGLISKASQIASDNPDVAKAFKSATDFTGGVGTILGGEGVVKGVTNALSKDAVYSIADDIAPNLTKKTGAEAIAKSGTKKSLIRGIIKPVTTKAALDDAQVIADNVPDFTKLNTFSDKVNATRKAVYDMADSLKNDVLQSGKDRVYTFKELASKIMKADEPISLKGTAFEKQIVPLKNAVIKIARKNGGKISDLFDTTKEFDQLVNKTWPNIWDKENAPMRSAVKAVRDTINGYIDKNLPEGTNFLERRRSQSKLFNAIDNMSPKAVDEIGTSRLQRLAGRHPLTTGLIKKGLGGAAKVALTGLGVEGAHKLIGD